jgi:alpha-amylase
MAFADQESKTFQSDTITIGLSLSNATSGTYQLDDYTPVKFTGSPKIRIGSDYKAGDTIKLTLTATDGSKTTSNVYEYTKAEAASSGVYIIFPASVISQNKWKTPVFAYIYDETTGNGTKVGGQVYKNAAWPGEELEYDSKLDAYYLEVNSKECRAEKTIKVQNGVAETASGVRSDFNLATSANTRVILSDSTQTTEGGKQYPLRGAKKPITLAGKTHKLVALNEAGWQVSTEVPGQSTTPVAATEVTKGNAVEPTTQPATTAPPVVSGMIYGDVNGDNTIDSNDYVAVKAASLGSSLPSAAATFAANVNGDAAVDSNDYVAVKSASLGGAITVNPYA